MINYYDFIIISCISSLCVSQIIKSNKNTTLSPKVTACNHSPNDLNHHVQKKLNLKKNK